MKDFAALFAALDQTTKTSRKVAALRRYFGEAGDSDKLWTIALLSGRRPRRAVTTTELRAWASEAAGLPPWLFEESYAVVGDLAETIALVLQEPAETRDATLSEWIGELRALAGQDELSRKSWVLRAWKSLPADQRLVFNKLITGGFRIGVSRKLMTRALADATGIDESQLAHRLMGAWSPDDATFETLIHAPDARTELSRPYPFCLAYQLDAAPETLGAPEAWAAEYKWDGIRAQIILREGELFVWSRGEELVTDAFPELGRLIDFVPAGTVIDGEIIAWDGRKPLSFNTLQTRIGRKSVPRKLLKDAPVALCAYDLLEWSGTDIRQQPLEARRSRLDRLLSSIPPDAPIISSPGIAFSDWDALAEIRAGARSAAAEGLMLKRLSSCYRDGRRKGDWWKWKLDPLSIDAVMVYAQAGHGRRANLYTDFTFAVWEDDALVPFTKAYSGLTDEEFRQITAWVRKNTLQRFGPVRAVKPEHVFEIAFEGIFESRRHKSGIALRFPRMARWRKDKPASEANRLADLKEMLSAYG